MTPVLPQAWDRAAEVLDRIPLAGERVRYAAVIKPLLSLPRSSWILEAGCGSGRILRALAALGFHRLVGLEISRARLEEVRRLGPISAQLVCCDEVPFPAEMFDAVVSAAVIEHVTDPPTWLAELASVTKPGGMVAIATDTNMWRWLEHLGLYRSIQPLDQSIWPWTLVCWARQSGLQLTACGGFVNTPDQRCYFGKQLLRKVPRTGRLRDWLNRAATLSMPADETQAILEAVESFPDSAHVNFWACIWSYECYYWFRKG